MLRFPPPIPHNKIFSHTIQHTVTVHETINAKQKMQNKNGTCPLLFKPQRVTKKSKKYIHCTVSISVFVFEKTKKKRKGGWESI